MRKHYQEGYRIFIGDSMTSYEEAAREVESHVNNASKAFKVEYIGGLQVKMDELIKSRYVLMREVELKPKKVASEAK